MCGKCLDLAFLYKEGFSVYGIELCEALVKEFFVESGLQHKVTTLSEDFKVYGTADNRLRIACGDFLEFKKDLIGGDRIKIIWDRLAMGSNDKEIKEAYARVMKPLVEDIEVKYLLDCWEYRDWFKLTATHNCPLEMIEDLLGGTFDIRELQRTEDKDKAKQMDSPTAYNVIYLLTIKKK